MECKHKFIHLRTESYYKAYRYTNSYFLIDYFFCEKCLKEHSTIKEAIDCSIYQDQPEWTIGITRKINMQ